MKKIVIIGPESTGKSTICQQLAAHYNTVWCPEYARRYLLNLERHYTYDDLYKIARGQLVLQEEMKNKVANNCFFMDTDMYVMKVWYEEVFQACPAWILKKIASIHYDLYLLCNIDLPWIKDELREYPDIAKRQKLFKTYKDIVINSGINWVEISGAGDKRFEIAVNAVDRLLSGSLPSADY